VCELCGSEESYLGSPFVRGFTRSEYEVDLHGIETDDASSDGGQMSVLPSASSFGTGIKGFRSRNKALDGLVWAPVDELDAETEAQECTRVHRPLKEGSLVVHECCADFLHFSRRLSQGRSQNVENNRIVEVLAGLGRAKTSPLGVDRLGHSYWVFAGFSSLFISNSTDGGREEVDMEPRKTSVWRLYPAAEVGSLLRWLDERLPSEHVLKRTLSLLFPDSLNVMFGKSSLSTDSVSGEESSFVATRNGLSEEEVVVEEDATIGAVCVGEVGMVDSDGDESDENEECEENATMTAVEDTAVNDDSEDENGLVVDRQTRKSQRPRRDESRSSVRFEHVRSAPRSSTLTTKPTVLRRGEVVLVESSPLNRILWEARILESRVMAGGFVLYKVHFLQWDASYDGWYDSERIVTGSEALTTVRGSVRGGSLRALMQESRSEHFTKRVSEAPLLLHSLTAFQFMDELNRACGPSRASLTFSDASSSDVALLRSAMLMIEMALPLGAVDEADDRWGDNFVVAWRQAVVACSDVTGLMQCQIMLEYGVRTAWLKPAGLKLFSCMPSRALCMRSPSIGLVAMRIWLLDLTVRYDKVLVAAVTDKAPPLKGRPPYKASTSSSTKSGRSKTTKEN
jgi:hypothetical protein